eukprot:TRINITY_DN8947_c0_g1_i1.p2 TRINITY_DN8947_c0_g1~~TRINITY_DN8947_c0_g1_i1.p2  ORF type:complete len:161 (-),score=62.31 TRINITY_DN8947_c0_g1_i1:109-591(-)
MCIRDRVSTQSTGQTLFHSLRMIASLFLCILLIAVAFADEQTIEQTVFAGHLAALGGGDVPRVVADYAHASVIISGDGRVFKGLTQIEAIFTELVENLFRKDQFDFALTTETYVDHVLFIEWSLRTHWDGATYRGTDTFVFENEKIMTQTVSITPGPIDI